MGSMKDMLLDLENEDEDLFDEEEEYTDQEDDYKAQCAQLMDMVKKANQNTEALLAMLQKKSDEVDALLKELSTQQSGVSAQWEYGIYTKDDKDDYLDFPTIGKLTYYCDYHNSMDTLDCKTIHTSLLDLGRQGWEAFAVTSGGVKVNAMIMKRRVQ